MIVAIIGADGAGKTSTAKDLHQSLVKDGINAEFSKAFEDYFLLKYPLSFFVSKREKFVSNVFVEGTKSTNQLFNAIWPLVIYLDFLLLYSYLRIFKRQRIVVFDRYAYSFLVTWEYYGFSSALTSFLYKRFPRPDLCVVLRADAKTLMRRKSYQREGRGSSYNIKFFLKHLELYDDLVKDFGFEVIASKESRKKVVACIKDLIKKKKI